MHGLAGATKGYGREKGRNCDKRWRGNKETDVYESESRIWVREGLVRRLGGLDVTLAEGLQAFASVHEDGERGGRHEADVAVEAAGEQGEGPSVSAGS